ncbi:hypothetical protein MTP99_015678 [Tenebrio molitor]|nr:hypothetical protein MTP99_015678 [Tenebrio molitor]
MLCKFNLTCFLQIGLTYLSTVQELVVLTAWHGAFHLNGHLLCEIPDSSGVKPASAHLVPPGRINYPSISDVGRGSFRVRLNFCIISLWKASAQSRERRDGNDVWWGRASEWGLYVKCVHLSVSVSTRVHLILSCFLWAAHHVRASGLLAQPSYLNKGYTWDSCCVRRSWIIATGLTDRRRPIVGAQQAA